jgi:hypothetical protein
MYHLFLAMLAKLFLTVKMLFPLNLAGTFPPLFSPGNPGRIEYRRLETNLTSAQLLALNTTAVPLVPAPGVGYMIVPRFIKMTFVAGSVAYLDGGGGDITFQLGTGITQALANNNIVLVTVSPNRRVQFLPWTGFIDTAANPPAEDNGALTITKATGNLTAGNGTMSVMVEYTVEPTTA